MSKHKHTIPGSDDSERRANAALIAAAPAMLAALEECITDEGARCFSNAPPDPDLMRRRLNAINTIARAAISLATGKEPHA